MSEIMLEGWGARRETVRRDLFAPCADMRVDARGEVVLHLVDSFLNTVMKFSVFFLRGDMLVGFVPVERGFRRRRGTSASEAGTCRVASHLAPSWSGVLERILKTSS